MKLAGIAATAMGIISVVSAVPHQAAQILEAAYPGDFVRRQLLNACNDYDLALDRFNPRSRDECYRALPKESPEQGHAQVGLAVNQIDLGRTAHLAGAPRNDIGLMEATEAVRAGMSR
jgi:hypothetical protein